MASCRRSRSLCCVLLITTNVTYAQEFQCPTNTSTPTLALFEATYRAFPGVNLVKPVGNPRLGKGNFTYTCALAFDQYLNSGCINTPDVWVANLRNDSQYPCGATWNGDSRGAPFVRASTGWVQSHFEGWEISPATDLNAWLQLLVGFLLPAAVFCLNVPRRRQLALENQLFIRRFFSWNTITVLLGAVAAVLVVIIDTIAWLFTVLALAAPLLLSGLYEACLDYRVINFIDREQRSNRLPLALQARMLFTILCGNLDLYPAWTDSMQLASSLDTLDERSNDPNIDDGETIVGQVSARLNAMLACQYGFGPMIGAPILFYIGSFLYTLLDARQNLGDNDVSHALSFGIWWMVIPHVAIVAGLLLGGNNPNTLTGIVGTQSLNYSLGEIHDKSLTLRRTSTYTHFSVIEKASQPWHSRVYRRVYDAPFQPASMYNRGASKQSWLLVLCTDALLRYRCDTKSFEKNIRPAMEHFLSNIVMLSPWAWLCLGTVALALIVIPCYFGFLQAWFTPQIGLSCRSLTFLTYSCAQALLLALWIARTTWRDKYWYHGTRIKRSLTSKGRSVDFWNELEALREIALVDMSEPFQGRLRRYSRHHSTSSDEESGLKSGSIHSSIKSQYWSKTPISILTECIYRGLMVLGLGISIFCAIGGTLMQLLGVYRNDVCKVDANYWLSPHKALALLDLSTDSPLDISEAKGTWTILASLSVGVLVTCCYIGWSYQTKLRYRFKLVADGLVKST